MGHSGPRISDNRSNFNDGSPTGQRYSWHSKREPRSLICGLLSRGVSSNTMASVQLLFALPGLGIKQRYKRLAAWRWLHRILNEDLRCCHIFAVQPLVGILVRLQGCAAYGFLNFKRPPAPPLFPETAFCNAPVAALPAMPLTSGRNFGSEAVP